MAITLNQSRHGRMGWQLSLPGRSKRLPTVAGGLVAIGLLLAACGAGPDVEEPPAPAAAPAPALEEAVRPVPAAVPAEPVAATPDAQAISDYLAFCVPGGDIDLAGMDVAGVRRRCGGGVRRRAGHRPAAPVAALSHSVPAGRPARLDRHRGTATGRPSGSICADRRGHVGSRGHRHSGDGPAAGPAGAAGGGRLLGAERRGAHRQLTRWPPRLGITRFRGLHAGRKAL